MGRWQLCAHHQNVHGFLHSDPAQIPRGWLSAQTTSSPATWTSTSSFWHFIYLSYITYSLWLGSQLEGSYPPSLINQYLKCWGLTLPSVTLSFWLNWELCLVQKSRAFVFVFWIWVDSLPVETCSSLRNKHRSMLRGHKKKLILAEKDIAMKCSSQPWWQAELAASRVPTAIEGNDEPWWSWPEGNLGEAVGTRRAGRWAGCLERSGVIPPTFTLSLSALYVAPVSCHISGTCAGAMTFRLR